MDFTISVEKSQTRTKLAKRCFLEYASTNREAGHFNDVIITIDDDDDEIPANRMVLSYSCEFFEKMFKVDMKESRENSVKLQGVEARAVKQIIGYFYTGIIEINNENVIEILSAADYLQVDEVKGFCSEFLQSVITVDTCVIILTLSKMYRLDTVEQEAYQFIKENFEAVKHQCCFLTKDDFISCISKLDRNRSMEISIYQAMVTWVKHQEEERKQEFPDLLKLINFKNLPTGFLKDEVSKEDLVSENLLCTNLVMSRTVQLFDEKAIKCQKTTKIISFGGTESPSKVVDIYSSFDDPLTQYPDLPVEFCRVIGGKLNSCVYSIGSRIWNGVCKLGEVSLNWKTVVKPDGYCQAAIYKDMLVAIGVDGNSSTLKCYFPALRSWVIGPQLQQTRTTSCELVTCNNSLYALGGTATGLSTVSNRLPCISSVERISFQKFDNKSLCNNCRGGNIGRSSIRSGSGFSFGSATQYTQTPPISVRGQWETLQHMQIPRSSFSAVSCNNRIYAIGGQSNTTCVNPTKTVELYDPTSNAWSYVSEMNYARSDHAACVMDEKIYVVGGSGNGGDAVKAIECYDPSCDTWTIVGNTVDELCGHSLITL